MCTANFILKQVEIIDPYKPHIPIRFYYLFLLFKKKFKCIKMCGRNHNFSGESSDSSWFISTTKDMHNQARLEF